MSIVDKMVASVIKRIRIDYDGQEYEARVYDSNVIEIYLGHERVTEYSLDEKREYSATSIANYILDFFESEASRIHERIKEEVICKLRESHK